MPKGLYQKFLIKTAEEPFLVDYVPKLNYWSEVGTWSVNGNTNDVVYKDIATSYYVGEKNVYKKDHWEVIDAILFDTTHRMAPGKPLYEDIFEKRNTDVKVYGYIQEGTQRVTLMSANDDGYNSGTDIIWGGKFTGNRNGSNASLTGVTFKKLSYQTVYNKGDFLGEVIADVGKLPTDGRAGDGYWYTFIKLVSEISANINGVWKNAYDAWANINGVWKPQNEMKANVNGIWR